MNRLLLLVFGIAATLSSTAQIELKDNPVYSVPIEIDSSKRFIIAPMIDKSNKQKYSFGQYNRYNWTNVFIYYASTAGSKKLFAINPVLVFPIYPSFNIVTSPYQQYTNSIMAKDHLLLAVKTDTYKSDGIIDEDDPTYLYIWSKKGETLNQLTAVDLHVISYTLSADQTILLVKGQKDTNGDKKFSNEEEVFYQFNLSENISKIKAIPVKL